MKRVSFGAIGLLLFALMSPALYAAISDNLVSCWSLDSTAWADAYGGNTLTDHGTVANVAGKVANAGDFELANSNYLSHTSNAALQMGDIDFTFAVWVKPESTGSSMEIIAKDDDAVNSRDYTLTVDIGGGVRFYFNGGGTPEVTSSVTMSAGNWYFIVVYHDATANTVNISINDGTVDSHTTGGAAPQTSAAEFRIGSREYFNFEEYFDGLIDEPVAWKRKISAAEITDLYNGGSGRPCSYIVPAGTSGRARILGEGVF